MKQARRRRLLHGGSRGLIYCVILFCLFLQTPLYAQESSPKAALTDLKDYEQLLRVFHSDTGSVRLVTLLSPT